MSTAANTDVAWQASKPQVLVRDSDHLVFSYDRMFVNVWQGETRLDAVQRILRLAPEFAARLSPQRFCLLTVVEAGAPLPEGDARAALARLLHRNPHLIRSAVAFEGTGFRAAAVRAVATSIAVLSQHQFPHRIFPGASPALSWLSEGLSGELGTAPSIDELCRALEFTRRPGLSGARRRA